MNRAFLFAAFDVSCDSPRSRAGADDGALPDDAYATPLHGYGRPTIRHAGSASQRGHHFAFCSRCNTSASTASEVQERCVK